MKRLLYALAALALAIVLMPAQEAMAATGTEDDPIAWDTAYLVAGVYYLNEPLSVPESYDCHYQMDWWTGAKAFNKVIQIDGKSYRVAKLDTMEYKKAFYVSKVEGTATCTEGGTVTHWKCAVCGRMYSDKAAQHEITEAETQAANGLGHDWGAWTPDSDGETHTHACQRTGCTASETEAHHQDKTIDASNQYHQWACYVCSEKGRVFTNEPHVFEDWTDNKDGTHTGKCVCGRTITEDHSGGKATCTKKAKCEKCGVAYGKLKAHKKVVDPAVAATCTKTGLTEGAHCSVCNKVLVKQKKVAKTAHTEVIDKAVAATCTKTGLTEGKHCSVCGKVLVKQKKVAKTAHTEVIDKAVAATCEKTGLTEGKHCAVCGKVIKARREVPAKAHWYGAWQPAGENTHVAACLRCGETSTVKCTLMEAAGVELCPICGYCADGANLSAVAGARAEGAVPGGDLTVFVSAPGAEARFLTVAFEVGGRLTQPGGAVTVTLPAAVLEGYDLMRMGDEGAQAPVEWSVSGGEASLTLDFMPDQQPTPAVLMKLIPQG